MRYLLSAMVMLPVRVAQVAWCWIVHSWRHWRTLPPEANRRYRCMIDGLEFGEQDPPGAWG